MLVGTLLVSFGVVLYTNATLLTGGLAGLALLASYFGWLDFGWWFFLLNLPFYALAIFRMGWPFTIKTFIAVTLVSIWPRFIPMWMDLNWIHPLFSAIAGGTMIGYGMLSLFRHGSGIGGFNILVQYLQEKHGLRAGYVQMALDLSILCASFLVIAPERIAYSVVGAVILNLILAINHKPGRYAGFS